eukprot:COSAG05_NODE_19447_length_292_cov_1.300518_1_plen_65_part_01
MLALGVLCVGNGVLTLCPLPSTMFQVPYFLQAWSAATTTTSNAAISSMSILADAQARGELTVIWP